MLRSRGCTKGFTLIELVAVLVLLGIVSVVVLPRFLGRDGFAEYALRDELVAAYRIAQQRATYDHSGACYSLGIFSDRIEPQRNGSPFGNVGQVYFSGDYSGLNVTPPGSISFDGLGNAYSGLGCGGTAYSGNLTVGSISVTVYPTGFIRPN